MTQAKSSEIAHYTEPSLFKQRLYSMYANGEITRQQLAEGIGNIQPPEPQLSWKYRLAAAILIFLINLFIPPSARRND
jgi:hypothetical protein